MTPKEPFRFVQRDPRWTDAYWEYVRRLEGEMYRIIRCAHGRHPAHPKPGSTGVSGNLTE